MKSRVILLLAASLLAAQAPKKSALDKATLEAYVRHLVPYPAQIKIEVGDPSPSSLPGFSQVRVLASMGERFKQHIFEVSADGQRFFEATVYDVAQNPFAADLAKLKTEFQPSLGTAGAPVTLVLFSDFQCTYCREQSRLLRENLLKAYPKEVRLFFKDYPLDQIHPWARPGAIAARCVFRQNAPAFWDFHDYLFDKQSEFTAANLKEKSLAWVTGKGLNVAQFTSCFDTRATEKEVDRNVADGRNVQVGSTPTLFVNGRKLAGVLEWPSLKSLIDLEIDYQSANAKPADAACCSVELPPSFVPKKK
ncbi:MAG: DsbA family protein [Bryobacteraceae bacterium]|nr:DsbA family protein [Bryobacteraceae bacterium]